MTWNALPKCRECNARIAFVPLMTWDHQKRGDLPVVFSNKMPIDIDPSPIGTVVLFTWPKMLPGSSGRSSLPGVPVRNVGRRLSPQEAELYRSARGVLYRVHFDSCPARRGRER